VRVEVGPVHALGARAQAILDLTRQPPAQVCLDWAAKIAVACRCAQEVREIGADPELDAMLRQADSRR